MGGVIARLSQFSVGFNLMQGPFQESLLPLGRRLVDCRAKFRLGRSRRGAHESQRGGGMLTCRQIVGSEGGCELVNRIRGSTRQQFVAPIRRVLIGAFLNLLQEDQCDRSQAFAQLTEIGGVHGGEQIEATYSHSTANSPAPAAAETTAVAAALRLPRE